MPTESVNELFVDLHSFAITKLGTGDDVALIKNAKKFYEQGKRAEAYWILHGFWLGWRQGVNEDRQFLDRISPVAAAILKELNP